MRSWVRSFACAYGRRATAGLALALVLLPAPAARATEVVKTLKTSERLVRNAFHYELLRLILERTVPQYGPYVENPYTEPMSTARPQEEALKDGLINVLINAAGRPEIDTGLIPVPLPIDKGLLGYRVSLVAAEDRERFGWVRTLADLRKLSVGQDVRWSDVAVFQHNGVRVELSPSYESLFTMVMSHRFDLLPRGVTEIGQEFNAYKERYPGLAIEPHLLLRYPFAQFFYVSRAEPRLAQRLTQGFEQMVEDGSFDALFAARLGPSLAALHLERRTVIELENPFLPAWVPLGRKELWLKPSEIDRFVSHSGPGPAINSQ